MDIVVLKFGGTSVTTLEKRQMIIEIVKNCIKNNETPIVVVSAIGRYPDAYATDTLISLVNDNFKASSKCGMDLLMSCGETISSVVISSCLNNYGINSLPVTGFQAGIITDDNFSNANVIDFNDSFIKKLLNDNIVPVVTGFQGITKDGFITTLGRGGSDTTATVLGAYLKAKRVDIFTDVDGLMNADPNLIKDAKIYDEISYDKAYEMACNGAKVINEKAILYAKEKNIPLYIKNTLKNNVGTLIH